MMNYKELRKGDAFTMRGRKGVLLSNSEYKTTPRSGLYYATVKWADGRIQQNFMICRNNIEWEKFRKA